MAKASDWESRALPHRQMQRHAWERGVNVSVSSNNYLGPFIIIIIIINIIRINIFFLLYGCTCGKWKFPKLGVESEL